MEFDPLDPKWKAEAADHFASFQAKTHYLFKKMGLGNVDFKPKKKVLHPIIDSLKARIDPNTQPYDAVLNEVSELVARKLGWTTTDPQSTDETSLKISKYTWLRPDGSFYGQQLPDFATDMRLVEEWILNPLARRMFDFQISSERRDSTIWVDQLNLPLTEIWWNVEIGGSEIDTEESERSLPLAVCFSYLKWQEKKYT